MMIKRQLQQTDLFHGWSKLKMTMRLSNGSSNETDPLETEAEPVSQVSETFQADRHPCSAATRDNFCVPALQSTSYVEVNVKKVTSSMPSS